MDYIFRRQTTTGSLLESNLHTPTVLIFKALRPYVMKSQRYASLLEDVYLVETQSLVLTPSRLQLVDGVPR